MPLTILMYGDCTSYDGRIRENVGLQRCRIREVSLYLIISSMQASHATLHVENL